jgi:hypothetical protein
VPLTASNSAMARRTAGTKAGLASPVCAPSRRSQRQMGRPNWSSAAWAQQMNLPPALVPQTETRTQQSLQQMMCPLTSHPTMLVAIAT